MPQPVLYHLLGAESSFNPNAGPSSAGARGIAQFIPSTAAKYGVDVNDATSSIGGAAHYLADLHGDKGSWTAALGAYSNQGPGLAGYAAEQNPHGPALVAAARQADLGGTPGLNPGAGPVAVDIRAVGGTTTTSVGGGLPISPAGETGAGGEIGASGPPGATAGVAESDATGAGFFGGIGAAVSEYFAQIAADIAHPIERAAPSGVTAAGPSITGEIPMPLPVAAPTTPSETAAEHILAPGGEQGAGATYEPPAATQSPSETAAEHAAGQSLDRWSSAIGAQTSSTEGLKTSTDGLKTAIDQAAKHAPGGEQGTPPGKAAGASAGSSDSGGFLSGLLGLAAVGGLVAALSRRHTAGTPASSSPGTVFTSHGITSQLPGSNTPALVPVNPQPSNLSSTLGLAVGGIGVLSALSKLFGGDDKKTKQDASTDSNTQATQQNTSAVQALTAKQQGGAASGAAGGPAVSTGAAATAPGSNAYSESYQETAAGEQDFSGGTTALAGTAASSGAVQSTLSGFSGLAAAIGKVIPGFSSLTSVLSSTASGFGSLLGSLGKIAGGIFGGGSGGGGLFGIVGSIFGFAGGGVVPSAAGGMTVDDGKGGTLAILHPQEMVLPAKLSLGVQRMIDQAGGAPTALGGFTVPRAPAPSVLSPDFTGGGLMAAGNGRAAGVDMPVHPAGGAPISVNITSFDGHDIRRVLTSAAGRNAIAEAFAAARRGNSRHQLSDG